LPFAVAFERFQAITGRLFQIIERSGTIQIKQFTAYGTLDRAESHNCYIVE
jgi:hypothetical protein